MSVTKAATVKLQSVRKEITQHEGKVQELRAVEKVLIELSGPVAGTEMSKKETSN